MDSFQGETFNLRATCIWNINDFPIYGLFVGCVTKGLVGCPPCGLAIESWSFKKLKNIIYYGNRYLPRSHPFRWAQNAFNGEIENKVAPQWVTASETIRWGKEQKTWLQSARNKAGAKYDLVHRRGIKWHNIMFKLPYWKVSRANQNIEFLHIMSHSNLGSKLAWWSALCLIILKHQIYTKLNNVFFMIVSMNCSFATPWMSCIVKITYVRML